LFVAPRLLADNTTVEAGAEGLLPAIVNRPIRELCDRLRRGESPSLAWPELLCGIGLDVMLCPVSLSSGETYSAQGLQTWCEQTQGQGGAPQSRHPLREEVFYDNRLLEKVIDILQNAEEPLRWAALHGDLAALRRAVADGADPAAQDAHGQTALHLAAKYGHLAAAQLLLAHGAPIDRCDAMLASPLNRAVRCDHVALVQLLVEAGADPHAEDIMESSPWLSAIEANRPALLAPFAATPA
ncbi:MAG: hypothetical protein EOO40_13240, partial [Deltaproteobacteria bacterium]